MLQFLIARATESLAIPRNLVDLQTERTMPEVYVYALEGRTTEQKSALMKDITDAVARNFAVDPEAVVVSIVETPKTDKAKGGIPFSERQRT